MKSIVSITSCADYSPETVKAAFERALTPFGELTFARPGARIVIKANLVSMMKPESAATTHPALLCELCRILIARGAQVTVGDSPGGLYTSAYVNAVYTGTGVRAVLETGAKLNQNFEHVHALNPGGKTLKELDYTSYLDDADAIIDFCKLKTHGMMGMSACVKNMFGCVPGVFKPEYHYKFPNHRAFADMLIDLNERFKPVLCVVDAVTGMEGNGPTAGTPRHIGALLVSDSPYACDRVCADIIGIEPEQVETIAAARERGLEPEAQLTGNPADFAVKDYELVRVRKELSFGVEAHGLFGKVFGRVAHAALCSVPKLTRSECVGCEKCYTVCPAHAIEMRSHRPVIDRSKCIRCFCCQEFCPKGAMKVKRPLIAKMLNR
ncbi:MAG: DUF362 domain-containing protein [Clostridia bacterium]|nr:DUF362 domain-containing protein [Clostridia bacterium]